MFSFVSGIGQFLGSVGTGLGSFGIFLSVLKRAFLG